MEDTSPGDKVIDKVIGITFNGLSLIVEPSVASDRKRGSVTVLAKTVQIGNGR